MSHHQHPHQQHSGRLSYTLRACLLIVTALCTFVGVLRLSADTPLAVLAQSTPQPVSPQSAQGDTADVAADYPPDLTTNLPWSAGFQTLSDVQQAFNSARNQENSLLDSSMPSMDLPAAAAWSTMDDNARALWLINDERTARGLLPLQGTALAVREVAQDFADYLLAHNEFGHEADGNTPWERLHANDKIDACHDFLGIAENLYWQGTTSPDPLPFIIEQAIYNWLYVDKQSDWGHRHALLWTNFTDNAPPTGAEGLMGIGRAQGSFIPSTGNQTFPNSAIVVYNVFDPCATWEDEATDAVPPSLVPTPPPTVMPATPPSILAQNP